MFFNDNQWIIHKLRASQSMSRLIGVHASSTWKRSVWDRFTSVMVLFNYNAWTGRYCVKMVEMVRAGRESRYEGYLWQFNKFY